MKLEKDYRIEVTEEEYVKVFFKDEFIATVVNKEAVYKVIKEHKKGAQND